MRRQGSKVVPAQRNATPGPLTDRAVVPPVPPGLPTHPSGPVEARLRYWFDTTLSRGTPALVGWLALACLALVVPVSALLVWTDHRAPATLSARIAAVWRSTGQTLRLGGEVGPPLRVALSVLLALIALFYVSTLVSLITTGITDKLLALDRGHARVVESGHTVVLGWSEQIPTVVAELVTAHAQRRRGVVTVLADRGKADMEEEFRGTVGPVGRARLLCRTGRPTDPVALARVSPATAECVLVLPRDSPGDDAEVVKTLLSLTAAVGEEHPVRVVAAVRGDRYLGAARLAGGPRATVLDTDDLSARLLVQCARQPGLSLVHQELLDFAGHEFYTVREPGLCGLTFHEAAAFSPVSAVVGIAHEDGTVSLNPPGRTPVLSGDGLIVIAEHEDATHWSAAPHPCDPTAIRTGRPVPPGPAAAPERFLLLGWNRRAHRIAVALSRRTPPGSVLDVVAEPRTATVSGIRALTDAVGHRLFVRHHPGDPTLRETTDALDPTAHDAVIVLAADARPGQEDPDDRTLVTLLHLRARDRERVRADGRCVPVVTEMADDRNRLIAPHAPGADFVVSGRLIGLLMTQISQNPWLAAVFQELFAEGGSSLRIDPAGRYIETDREVSFATVVESAARQGACAIGYRARGPAHGLCVNPPKSQLRHWRQDDEIVVLAPEE
ncbi:MULTISPECIES: NAD-binding lipoprotein [unclassified Streptomyces]|uniref:CASTOR/POLLUX-related putative ion channel n=1 Tax=unclassified Streptomyces TaxID=2593676 RepID=UPI001F5BCB3F|nr:MULTISPECIES: NAD-binding lipoprotein [unclassified Streptomyces]